MRKPQPHRLIADWLGRRSLIDWGSRITPASPGDDKFPSPDKNPSIYLQRRQPGDENGHPPGPTTPHGMETPVSPIGRSLIGLGSNIEPAHPGEDRFPSPDRKSFHTSTNPTTLGRKRSSLGGSTPPRTVWKLQPQQPIADWLVFV